MLIQINIFGHGSVEELEKMYEVDEDAIVKNLREEFKEGRK